MKRMVGGILFFILALSAQKAEAIRSCLNIIESIQQRNRYVEKLRELYEQVQLGEFYMKDILVEKNIKLEEATKKLSQATLELNILNSSKDKFADFLAIQSVLELQIQHWLREAQKFFYFDLDHRLKLAKARIDHAQWIIASIKANPIDKEEAIKNLPEFEKDLQTLQSLEQERKTSLEKAEAEYLKVEQKYGEVKSQNPQWKEIWERPLLHPFFDNKGSRVQPISADLNVLLDPSGKSAKKIKKEIEKLKIKLAQITPQKQGETLRQLQETIKSMNDTTLKLQKIDDPRTLIEMLVLNQAEFKKISRAERDSVKLWVQRLQLEYRRLVLEIELDQQGPLAKQELILKILENELELKRYEGDLDGAYKIQQDLIKEKKNYEKKLDEVAGLKGQAYELNSKIEKYLILMGH